jgi:CPA2 family monovalent cation:H+ antiporter-2
LQVSFAGLAVFFLSQFTGQDTNTSIVLGGLTALSSTAIVLKLLFDRAEIDSPHGRVSLGILIFQDFCVVLFILLIPMLKGAHSSMVDVAWVLGKSIVFITAVIVAARWIVPNALHQIVHTRMRELFVISIIFICLGTAYLTYELGFSLALGAFIAGLVVSESEYSYQATADILPFKDSFNGLFFISVGMLMDIHFLWVNLESVMLFVCVLIILKIFTTTAAAFFTGSNLRVSLHSGLILAQVGEFSFVLAVTALKQDLITDNTYQLFLSSAIISMLITPLFVAVSSNVSIWVTSRRLLARVQAMRAHGEPLSMSDGKTDHVIIIGFGVNGRNLSLVLKELEVPYTILELNSQTVLTMRKQGEPIFYGDGTSQEILHKLGIEKAKVVVISITDPAATRKIAITARKMNPELYIVVKTRYIAEVEDLFESGADEVIPAEFETSIELFCRILHFYQMPKGLIGQYADQFRKNHYSMFIKGDTQKKLFHDTLALMPDVHYESFVVKTKSPAIDSSIRSLDIQNQTGALVIAVRRDNKTMRGLTPDFEFQKGDIIFLIGDNLSLQNANKLFFRKNRS